MKRELKAWDPRYERALAKASKAAGDARKMRPVLKEFASIQKTYPDTLAGREAGRRLGK